MPQKRLKSAHKREVCRRGLSSAKHPLPRGLVWRDRHADGREGREQRRQFRGLTFARGCPPLGKGSRPENDLQPPPPLRQRLGKGEGRGRGGAPSLTEQQRLVAAAPARLSLSRSRGLRREQAKPGRGLLPPKAAARRNPSRMRLAVSFSFSFLRRTAQQPSGPERHIRSSAVCKGRTMPAYV